MTNHEAMKSIQETCRSGQSDENLMFCTQHEPNAKRIVLSLRAMEKLFIEREMEGVFIIKTEDGKSINVFQEPGLITSMELVDKWCDDLTTKGVWNDNGKSRLLVCPHDLTNLTWSCAALIDSCTESLEDGIAAKIGQARECGPKALGEIPFRTHRPSHSKIEALRTKLKALQLTDFPAEDVSLFIAAADPLICEIKMNFMQRDQVPTLTTDALNGLKTAMDPFSREIVMTLSPQSDVNGFGSKIGNGKLNVFDALEQVCSAWDVMVNQGSYGPAQQVQVPGVAAMQGEFQKIASKEFQKLEQNRNAASTKGNSCQPHRNNDCNRNERSGATHGLSDEEARHIIQLCHVAVGEMPDGKPDQGTRHCHR